MAKFGYEIVLVLVAVVVAYFVGHKEGVSDSEKKQLSAYNEALENNLKAVDRIDAKLHEQGEMLNKIREDLSVKKNEVTKGVVKYTETPDSSVKCLDTNWVRLYNQSLPSPRTKNTP